jgi:hypothetical protein
MSTTTAAPVTETIVVDALERFAHRVSSPGDDG